jgi:hypothetical protein
LYIVHHPPALQVELEQMDRQQNFYVGTFNMEALVVM